MYKNHREAFQLKKGSKHPIESNLDNIINQTSIKMKAMIFRNYPSWYKIMEYLKELEQNIHDIKFK